MPSHDDHIKAHNNYRKTHNNSEADNDNRSRFDDILKAFYLNHGTENDDKHRPQHNYLNPFDHNHDDNRDRSDDYNQCSACKYDNVFPPTNDDNVIDYAGSVNDCE